MNTDKKKIALYGTSRFAVIVFAQLLQNGIVPALVITQPSRPQGRKLALSPSPAKIWALSHNIPVLQPEQLDDAFSAELRSDTFDLAIVASYGTIIPPRILALFPHHALNVHPSLLPKYRGATPLQTTILTDDRETGVTIIKLDNKMDHGPIVASKKVEISDWPPNLLRLEETLAEAGGMLLAQTIDPWIQGKITTQPQNDNEATFTKKILKSDGELNLSGNAYKNFLKIQAFDPWPGTYFFTERHGQKMRVKVTGASYKDGQLIIERIIPEGGKDMAYQDFLRNS